MEQKDAIRPDHYRQGGLEAFDVMKAFSNSERYIGFLINNVVKYVLRHEHKNGVEDLKKAREYLDKAIKEMEGQ